MRAGWTMVACLSLAACAAPREQVVLLESRDGRAGAVEVRTGKDAQVIDRPLGEARIRSGGEIERRSADPAEVQQVFGAALAAQPMPPATFRLYFPEGSFVPLPSSGPELQKLFEEIARRRVADVQVTGHTDRKGALTDNDRLSLERARGVREFLIQRGIRAEMIIVAGRGEREPLIQTPDGVDEPQNRRVEVTVR